MHRFGKYLSKVPLFFEGQEMHEKGAFFKNA
jgi:hypothetical protein